MISPRLGFSRVRAMERMEYGGAGAGYQEPRPFALTLNLWLRSNG